MRDLILCGFKGCGKSYWGQRLATKLARPFIDTDSLIEELAGGKSCREIALTEGEKRFRDLERQVVMALTTTVPSVIATGGGTVLSWEMSALLKKRGVMIYLRSSKGRVTKKMLTPPLPSYLRCKDPIEAFEILYRQRKSVYEEVADVTVDLEDIEEERRLDHIMEFVG